MFKSIKYIFVFFIVMTSVLLSQNYPNVSIRDIQFVPMDSLLQNKDKSPRVGDTIRVTGIVMVAPIVSPSGDRRPIMWAGGRWQVYLQDTSNQNEWVGLNVIQNDTSTAAAITLMDLLDTTQIVTVTGRVEEFGLQTQLAVLTTVPIEFLGSVAKRPEPIELTIADFNVGAAPNPINNIPAGEKYEGQYVVFRNVISSNRNVSNGTFYINDGLGNSMYIHDQSGYFTRRTHKLRDFDPPIDGSTIAYIRGVIGHFNNPNHYVLRPMYPNDMFITDSPPAISSVRRDKDSIRTGESVTISASIIEYNTGDSVASAKLYYRIQPGNIYKNINMVKTSADRYSATIPGTELNADSMVVSFYIRATDATNLTSTFPLDTVRGVFHMMVLNRNITIQDVQYSPFGSGFSAYNNYRVTVSGVVTADTSDLQGDGNQVGRRVYIQNGNTPWSGIWVFGTLADQLQRGQYVTVKGLVVENNNNTRIDSITQVVINSSGNPLPEPVKVSTADIATSNVIPNGDPRAEKWEGVLIEYNTLKITRENADGNPGPNGGGNSNFGEIVVADTSNIDTRVELQEGNHKYHNLWIAGLDTIPGLVRLIAADKFTTMRGVLFYSFGNYKLVPRKDDDFIGYSTDINDLVENPIDYRLEQNYPNPFNPTTTISYSIPTDGFVQVKIFNILGQEVKSLVDMEQRAGNYKVIFDGKELSSGVYLYQIVVNNFVQTKKMLLMK